MAAPRRLRRPSWGRRRSQHPAAPRLRPGPGPGAGGHRPSLTLTFAVLSLVLTAAVGFVVSAQLTRTITGRSIEALRQTTTGGIDLTLGVILANKLQPAPGEPLTLAQEVAQATLMTTASRILVRDGQSVGVEAMLPNGAVIAGWGAAAVGTVVARDAQFRSALVGGTQTEILRRSQTSGVSTVERRLLRQHGDLLLVQVGVRLSAGSPVQVVVRTYAAMGPTQRQASADLRTLFSILALGLLVFWVVLFRLVLGTSRSTSPGGRERLSRHPRHADRAAQQVGASRPCRAGDHRRGSQWAARRRAPLRHQPVQGGQ